MSKKKNLFLASLLAFSFWACSDSEVAGGSTEDSGIVAITDKEVAGVSQKGPFVNGSIVRLYGFNIDAVANSGQVFSGKISSDRGEFVVPGVNLPSQYALLEAQGFYRNEVTGEKSSSQITLNAITDLQDRETVNVNLLTHLEYDRVVKLVSKGMTVHSAKDKVEKEILASFYVNSDISGFEDLNIFNSGKGDAVLLAVSILLQGDRSVADLSELLANYAKDIESDGTWDDDEIKTEIADWASQKFFEDQYGSIRANIESWKLGDVPQFEKYANLFWWKNYGLGVCNSSRQGYSLKNQNKLSSEKDQVFICEDNLWQKVQD